VFEGGGVLGLAFLGAARCCAEVGIRWKGLAGTSAGAITASLLAAVEKNDDLERLFAGLDFLHWPLLPRHSQPATNRPAKIGFARLLYSALVRPKLQSAND